MTSPIISFQDFGFQYDAQAEPTLHHINLDVYPGQKILIAGASGSGKSTVASCINGLIPHAYPGKITGKVLVDGKDVTQSSVFDLSHTVGTVLQDTDGQFIGLTVAEDIAFALENDCVPQDDMKKTVQRVAQLVDIEHHLDHAPHELSGGQKQRVSLAGVMVDDVKILLFDEPLANLDPAAGRAAIELIDEIQEKTGAAVLIIEHRLEDVLWRHVDRVVLMQDGAIVADLPPGELLCGNFLMERGIREPLYLTALRYARVPVTPEICPEHPDTLKLTDAQKKLVKKLKILTDAEAEYQKLFDQHKADEAAAKAVDEAVAKLAPVTLESGNAVKAARKAFDELTPAQRNFLAPETESKLKAAEAEYARLVKDAADKAAAKEVEDKIARLQPVTKDSGEAIKDARSSYEALTPEQKALVSKDSVAALDKAEKVYDMIIASTKPGTAIGDNTGSTSGSGVIKITANAAAKGEQNPHTGAPVMSMVPAVLVLAAVALVLKKHK